MINVKIGIDDKIVAMRLIVEIVVPLKNAVPRWSQGTQESRKLTPVLQVVVSVVNNPISE